MIRGDGLPHNLKIETNIIRGGIMKKLIFLFILSLLMIGMAWGQTTINFDDAGKWAAGSAAIGSYASDHVYTDGVFSATGGPALRNGTTTQDGVAGAFGTYSWRLRDNNSVNWTINIASGGVSTFSMAIRRWDGTPSPAYNLEYSTDGGSTWTLVTAINNTTLDGVSAWKTFEGTINSSNPNIKIRLAATGPTERIMVDDFIWTGFAGGDPVAEIPTFNPVAGTYYGTQNVTISSATAGANIFYTLNGDTPTDQSTPYTAPIAISQTTTVKAIAYASGHLPSSVATAAYVIVTPQFATIPYLQAFDADLGDTYTYSVSGPTKTWTYYAAGQAAAINGYGSTDTEEDWLILPGLNMNLNIHETMSFSTWKRYGTLGENDYLKLMYSANYAGVGDPSSATWTEIPFDLPLADQAWTPSGMLDLSGISGTAVFFAFKYKGTPDNFAQWNVDNISIVNLPPDQPIVTVNPASLSGFSYLVGAGPSAAQSFTVSGSNLTANISIVAPANYEISTSETTGFTSDITLTQSGGTVAETTLFVRLVSGLATGTYSGVSITVNSTDANEATVALTGSVTTPPPAATILMRPTQISLADATHESAVLVKVENYASDSVRYRLYNGSNQYYPWDEVTAAWVTSTNYPDGPLVPGTPSTSSTWWIPFQRGSNNSTAASYRDRLDPYSANYQTAVLPVTTAITSGSLIDDSQVTFSVWDDYTAKHIALAFDASETLISATSTNIGDGAFNIWVEDGTIITRIEIRDVMNNLIEAVTGTWPSITPSASLSVNPETLMGFSYEEGEGPSAEQSFTVSGTNLDASVTITAPTNFQISQTSGSGFGASLILNHTAGTLAETNVYVRLAAGLEVGSYTDEIINISSGTAPAKTVTVSGSVTAGSTQEGYIVDFEGASETKTAYGSGTVNLSGLDWNMTEALIGTDAADFKNGIRSARMRGYGTSVISMLADKSSGIGTVSFQYRRYGTDAQVDWKVEVSTDGGTSWTQVGDTFTAPASDDVQNFSQMLNISGNARIRIKRATESGSSNRRLNIDDITLTDYSAGTTPTIYVMGTFDPFTAFVSGPSAPQTYSLSGVNLTAGIIVTAPTGYQVSQNGTDYSQSTTVASDFNGTIYVRLNATTVGEYSGNITHTSTGADQVDLAVSGNVLNPQILVSGTVDPLYNIVSNPSEEIGSYTVSGLDLIDEIEVAAPTHFEIATNDAGPWSATLTLAADFNGSIYVRINSDVIGEHGGNITHNSTGATEATIRVEGETMEPMGVILVTSNMVAFSQDMGTPSAAQNYSLSGTDLTGDTTIATQAPFELSQDGSTGWAASINVPYNYNGLIYVRLNGTESGTFTDIPIVHTNAEAEAVTILVSGEVIPPPAANLFISEYIEGSSNNKALEIYNASGADVNLADYKLVLYSNGATTPGNTLNMEGILGSGEVYITANSGANAAILALANSTSTVNYFNGDDAVALVYIHGDVVIDQIGVIGVDPGTGWPVAGVSNATLDKTLIRKPTVATGNTDWAAQQGTNADDSEWIVMGVDYIADLGSHTYNPSGNPLTSVPVFDPPAGAYVAPINVSLTSSTAGATIRYTTDGSDPSPTVGTIYASPIAISASTTIRAIAYADGYDPSIVVEAVYAYPTPISDIATLRAQPTGSSNVYTLTGEAVLTYQNANRNTKYIQDDTAAIVIDDNGGIITSTYNLYDGITGITGYLNVYNQLIQFVPVADPGAASSSNNEVVPEVRTLASLTPADQAKLIKVNNVTITGAATFPATAQNLTATDGTATLTLRTFVNTDYAGTDVPTDPVTLTCLVGQFNATMQIGHRFLSDIQITGGQLASPELSITLEDGDIVLTWNDIDGAASYRIESADDPYGTFTEVTSTTQITHSIPASAAKKFYRVIAQP